MSREIKFRAWLKPRWEDDGDANKMYYDIQDSYDNLGNVKPFDPMTSFDSWFEDGVAIVEQYTGLKDKNGVEIYEGDIVNVYKWQYIKGKHRESPSHTTTIYWCDRLAQFRTTYCDDLSDEITEDFFEVVGNIHENPELLWGEDE